MLRRCDRTNVGCDGICEGGNMGVGQMVGDRDAKHLKKRQWELTDRNYFFFVIRQLMAKTENDLQSKQPTSTTHIWKLFHKASKHHSDNRVLSNDTESDTGCGRGARRCCFRRFLFENTIWEILTRHDGKSTRPPPKHLSCFRPWRRYPLCMQYEISVVIRSIGTRLDR